MKKLKKDPFHSAKRTALSDICEYFRNELGRTPKEYLNTRTLDSKEQDQLNRDLNLHTINMGKHNMARRKCKVKAPVPAKKRQTVIKKYNNAFVSRSHNGRIVVMHKEGESTTIEFVTIDGESCPRSSSVDLRGVGNATMIKLTDKALSELHCLLENHLKKYNLPILKT